MRRIAKESVPAVKKVPAKNRRQAPRSLPTPPSSVVDPTSFDEGDHQEILLSSSGTLISRSANANQQDDRGRLLVVAIRQRIESRLGQRILGLTVRIANNRVVLEGRCATYYSKQLAQHAALGILEVGQLKNEIMVTVP
jgi:hypothetical protein